ncbi:MAG: hypothetical protein MUC87_09490 [Bacteroidia bacterium]|jgi:hypothetical protein|nr:hypothetical protein [Bacteroidia bacterium]
MKTVFLFLLLAAMAPLRAATNFDMYYGMGVMHLNLEILTEIKLYSERNDKTAPAKTITFTVSGKGKTKTAKLETANTDKWLSPEILKPENMLFSMRVLSRETGWYQVMTNNGTHQTYWLRKIEGLEFYTWTDELLKSASVIRLTRDTNPLRTHQGSNVTLPWDMKYADCFKPLKILGIWMEVETRETCADGTTKIKSAWIQWRDDDGLLIDYSLLP